MKAVLTIFSEDTELYNLVCPHIDFIQRSIDWDAIFKLEMNDGHQACRAWAFALWRDEPPEGVNLFDLSLNTNTAQRSVILKGIAGRWLP